MADQQQRAGVIGEQFLEQFERFDVEVVGRLVHHQQVGRLREQPGQQQAVAFAAGQPRDRRARAFGGEQEILQVADHVLGLAADLDVFAALGDVLDRVPVLAQGGAVLVEVRDLQLGALLHFARLRLQFAQQELQQRGLAAAVRADQADAVAAQDGGGEIADEDVFPVRERHSLRLDHLPAGFAGLRGGHPDVAGLRATLRAFDPHRLQPAHAAFVAGTAGLDALPDPHFLLRQQLVEARVLLRLGVRAFLLAAQVVVPVARPAADLAAVDLDDARGQRAQEAAVVGDEHQRPAPLLEEAFQPVDRGDVEVIGRLVQQQQVRLRHQRPRQQHPALHPAREPGEIGVAVQLQAFQGFDHAPVQRPALCGLDFRLHRGQRVGIDVLGVDDVVVVGQQRAEFAQAGRDHVEHAARGVLRHFLFQPRDAAAAFHANLAVVGPEFAGKQLEQGRFPGAVAADQGDAFARFDGEVDALQQQGAADAVVHALQGDQGHAPSLAGGRGWQ